MASHIDPTVRAVVARHENLDSADRNRLAHDDDDAVVMRLRMRPWSAATRHQLVSLRVTQTRHSDVLRRGRATATL